MTIARAQVSFPSVGGDTEDTIVNNWSAILLGKAEGDELDWVTALDAFYTALGSNRSSLQSWGLGRIKIYDVEDPKPRAPFYDAAFATGTSGGTTAIPEVSCCLSFQGDPISGVRQGRRRGRVYLGPLAAAAVSTTTGLLTSTVTDAVRLAAENLLLASATSSDWKWIVLSETPTLNTVDVTNGWVDNAPDIQRRRGLDGTTRQTFG